MIFVIFAIFCDYFTKYTKSLPSHLHLGRTHGSIKMDFLVLKMNYSKNPHIRTYNFEMSLFMFLCERVIPVIRVPVLKLGSKYNTRKEYI